MRIVDERLLCKWKGKPVVLQTLEDDPMRYCIQYAGNGHYFPCEATAIAYAHGRGWIPPPRFTADHCGKEVRQDA